MFEVIFLTSNRTKLAHARFLCRKYTIQISKQKHYGVGYEEPRIDNRDELLDKSIDDAYNRLKNKLPSLEEKFFFIEDTSVRIHALSEEKEVPGVDIKYWMKENDFTSLDKQLKSHGNDRTVEVRSDIVLKLPHKFQSLTGDRVKKFTSKLCGRIIDKEVDISTNPLYPWLDNKSFNKWFAPDGFNVPISLLPIDEAEKNDFRAGAFNDMLRFFEDCRLIRMRPRNEELAPIWHSRQKNLFLDPFLFIVSGPTCAGKTTLADYITKHYTYYHIEASDYMYLSYYRRHGVATDIFIGDFAELALKENPRVVVDQIIEDIGKLPSDIPIIITGFRAPEEIESFKKQYNGEARVEVILVDAKPSIRYRRCLKRGRHDNKQCKEDFDKADKQQLNMGLSSLREIYTTKTIENNSTYENYFRCFQSRYSDAIESFESRLNNDINLLTKPHSLEEEILLSLYVYHHQDHQFTTTEIAKLINELFYSSEIEQSHKPKNKNNVSRYFNQDFHPYYEVKLLNGKRRYRLSQSGLGYAKWLLRLLR